MKLDFTVTKVLSRKTIFQTDIHPVDYWRFGDGSNFDTYAHQMGQPRMRSGLRTRHGGAVIYQNSNRSFRTYSEAYLHERKGRGFNTQLSVLSHRGADYS